MRAGTISYRHCNHTSLLQVLKANWGLCFNFQCPKRGDFIRVQKEKLTQEIQIYIFKEIATNGMLKEKYSKKLQKYSAP